MVLKNLIFEGDEVKYFSSNSRPTNPPSFISYIHLIYSTTHPSPTCPLCRLTEHNTVYLFNCPQVPTALDPISLWSNPTGAVTLLVLWTGALTGTQKTYAPRGRVIIKAFLFEESQKILVFLFKTYEFHKIYHYLVFLPKEFTQRSVSICSFSSFLFRIMQKEFNFT